MDNEQNLKKENLKIDNLKNMIIRDINFSNLPIGIAYYILKDIFNEITKLYNEQVEKEYKEFCDLMNKEDAEVDQANEESNSKAEEAAAANINEEGTN